MRLSIEAGASNRAGHTSANLAQYVNVWQGPRVAAHDLAQGIAFAESRGLKSHVATHQAASTSCSGTDLGEHDRLLAAVPTLAAALASYGWIVAEVDLHSNLVRLSTLRGERTDPKRLAWLDETVRVSNEPDDFMGIAASAPANLLAGNRQKAHDLLVELVPAMTPRTAIYWQPRQLPSLVRAALELGDIELAQSLVSPPIPCTYAQHAAVAARAAILEARGELEAAIGAYEDAAERWAAFGVVPEEAFALLGWGRALLSERSGSGRLPRPSIGHARSSAASRPCRRCPRSTHSWYEQRWPPNADRPLRYGFGCSATKSRSASAYDGVSLTPCSAPWIVHSWTDDPALQPDHASTDGFGRVGAGRERLVQVEVHVERR